MLKLDLEQLTVDSFRTTDTDATVSIHAMYEQESKLYNTVLYHTQQVSCNASDCGTCGGTECWA